ncbi:hypothetical protein [Bosea sp. NPDC055594]
MKVLQLISGCEKCPRRVYYSAGQYDCSAAEMRLPSLAELNGRPASFCPLADYAPSTPSLSERVAVLEAALRPFADFAQWTDAEGWACNIHREGISVWFGPSDFRRARAALPQALAPIGEAGR